MNNEPRGPDGRGSGHGANREEARELLVDAFTKVVSQRGYELTSIEEVTAVAGLPADAFGAHFGDKRQCLLAAFDRFAERLTREVEDAIDPEAPWTEKVRGGISAALAFVAERAEVARALVVESAVAGQVVIERYEVAMDSIAALLRRGRGCDDGRAELPETTERVLVAGAASLVISALLREERERILALEPELAEVLLLPYAPAIR